MNKRKINWQKIFSIFVLFSLSARIVFLIIAMILAPVNNIDGEPFTRVKSDYVLMLVQCILGVVAMLMPSFLKKEAKVRDTIKYDVFIYNIFILCYLLRRS